jgi:sugar lactone lactonase YvrE
MMIFIRKINALRRSPDTLCLTRVAHNWEAMTKHLRRSLLHLGGTLIASAVTLHAAAPITEITLPGERLFTESITSLKDGTLFVGSVGKGTVSRIAHGSKDATLFIAAGASDLHAIYGIYADQKRNTLWVCSNRFTNTDKTEIAAKSFDLKSGAFKASYPLSDASFCNDFAVAADGTVYIADTRQATLLMLRPGASALETSIKDPLLEGVDGLGFSDKKTLYVNSVSKGKLLRVDIGPDGKGTRVTELKLSRPIQRPDGMRTIGKNRFLLAEGTGSMDIVTIGADRESAEITTLKTGLELTPAVTAAKGMAWVAEGKLAYRSTPEKDPGPFKLYAVPLPKK